MDGAGQTVHNGGNRGGCHHGSWRGQEKQTWARLVTRRSRRPGATFPRLSRTARSSTSPLQSGQPGERQPVPTFLARCTPGGSLLSLRRDPVDLLEEQAQTRVPELVPIRYGRMLVSPFTFYRGAAYLMAADLAALPRTGLQTQLCGDAHLSNFGAFAAPDRRLVFSINDFDETLPGPVRVGRQATGRELRRRRARPRASTRSERARDQPDRRRAPTARRCAGSRRCATSTSGTRALDVDEIATRVRRERDAEADEAVRTRTSPRRARRTACGRSRS